MTAESAQPLQHGTCIERARICTRIHASIHQLSSLTLSSSFLYLIDISHRTYAHMSVPTQSSLMHTNIAHPEEYAYFVLSSHRTFSAFGTNATSHLVHPPSSLWERKSLLPTEIIAPNTHSNFLHSLLGVLTDNLSAWATYMVFLLCQHGCDTNAFLVRLSFKLCTLYRFSTYCILSLARSLMVAVLLSDSAIRTRSLVDRCSRELIFSVMV